MSAVDGRTSSTAHPPSSVPHEDRALDVDAASAPLARGRVPRPVDVVAAGPAGGCIARYLIEWTGE